MILTSIIAAVAAQSADGEIRLARYPDIHGEKYVFVYASDLWVADREGGVARRLTSHPGLEQNPRFSPDGKWIAFTGQYDGGNDVYVISVNGGTPNRLTYENGTEHVRDWTPDSKKVAYVSGYGNAVGMARLWFVSKDGGLPERTDVQEAFDVSFNSDGSRMAFNRAPSHMFNWRRYRGGTHGRISFWDFATNGYSEIPSGREQNYFPMWVDDSVFYISDKNQGTLNLYRYDTGNKRVTQLTNYADGDIRWPGTDGKTIIFERNLRLHVYDIKSGAVKQLDPRVSGDDYTMLPRYVNLSNSISGFAISPTGKRLVLESRGELYSVPANRGESRNLTDSNGARESLAEWAHDGQHIYYLTDRSGETQLVRQAQMGGKEEVIPTNSADPVEGFQVSPAGGKVIFTTTTDEMWVMDLDGKNKKLIHKNMGGQTLPYEWSGDGKFIVYGKTAANQLNSTAIYDVAAGKSHQVTSGFYNDNGWTLDRTGKFLYITSDRTFSPTMSLFEISMIQNNTTRVYVVPLEKGAKNVLSQPDDEEPVKSDKPEGEGEKQEEKQETEYDFTNMEKRMLVLPFPPAQYGQIAGIRNGVLVQTATGQLMQYSMTSKSIAPVASGVAFFTFNADRSKIAHTDGQSIFVNDVRPGIQPGQGQVTQPSFGNTIDPRKEYAQMFDEVWRFQRDEFYDKDMLGLDWDAIGKKYRAMLPFIGDRSDFDYIISQLIGELGTGHAYVTPGAGKSDPLSQITGYLGADYKAVGNRVQMTKVYRGFNFDPSARGPLGEPGMDVKDGDFILAIDGVPVTAQSGVSPLLAGKINRKVVVTINDKPTMDGSRTIEVRPVSSESNLRYETWVDERRQIVSELSGGRIGYMHVPDTSVGGIIGFIEGFYSQSDKEAMVIDERYNGGGWIPTFFIEHLQRNFTNIIAARHGAEVGLPSSLRGPKAMLINGYAGSGGDLFPYLFKKAGLGPLIGTRTWGGLVGISGSRNLMGGGSVTSPAFGIYDPETKKWIAENTGVDPDINIDDRPDLAAKGQDPQLERAIQELIKQLKEPAKKLQHPPFPKVDK